MVHTQMAVMNSCETINKSSTSIQVTATDADDGANGQVYYSILPVSSDVTDKFRIDSDSGQIEVTGAVERDEVYMIMVQAEDGSGTDPRLASSSGIYSSLPTVRLTSNLPLAIDGKWRAYMKMRSQHMNVRSFTKMPFHVTCTRTRLHDHTCCFMLMQLHPHVHMLHKSVCVAH